MVLAAVWSLGAQESNLQIELVGNAGVMLTDGTTSLLVDLPYESGAFGYMRYRPERLRPPGTVVSVITHHHRDHFDPDIFRDRPAWRIVGPPSAVNGLPPAQVLVGDSLGIGAFTVVAIPTPHTDDHRSYRIRWRGRVLYFVGDTEEPATVPSNPRLDLLFITPWLSCSLDASGRAAFGVRSVSYHLRPDGSDRVCGPVERLDQGAALTLTARPAGGR